MTELDFVKIVANLKLTDEVEDSSILGNDEAMNALIGMARGILAISEDGRG